ncbi:MAG TPA: T9SS type A sorting domain-containing protein, partial [Bacteroidia bacterium]|nr:T9SS type A sorting domain-containing protein [Bacteroidia bacterium]
QGLRCHCYFLQLMVSIMEVDQSKNSIGPEYLEWVYIYDSNTSVQDEYDNFIALDLNQYAPQGFHMQPGKKYKIRVASLIPDTYPSQFTYYDAFVSTFAPLNVINNQVLDYTMIGDNVIIQNSTSQINNTNLKVVASNSIRISVTSNLKSGRYYIDQVNCNNITNFRSSVSGQKRSQQGSLNENYLISESSIISGDNSQMRLSQNEFKIFPNPGNGYYTVSASNIHNSTVEIYNMFGVLIKSELVDNSESIIDISSCPNGMYIFRFKNQNGEQKSIKVIKE